MSERNPGAAGHGGLTRRGVFAGSATGAIAIALPGAAAARSKKKKSRAPRPRRADVVVIGAGLAGLAAANEVVRAGRSVIVLEGRDRVGGRTLNEHLPGGGVVEHGGAFLFSKEREHVIVGLAAELGVEVIEPHYAGNNVWHRDGRREEYPRHGPFGRLPPDAAAIPELIAFSAQMDSMIAEVPSAAPWEAPRAEEWDGQTFETWKRNNVSNPRTRFIIDMYIQTLVGVEPRDFSLLYMLGLIAGTEGMTSQEVVEAAAKGRFLGGSHEISARLARRLGRRVVTGAPVRLVEQRRDRVTAITDRMSVVAKQAIVATSPAVSAFIRFDPPLPAQRAQLVQRVPQGSVVKCHAIYDKPFWFDDGLTGEAWTDLDPIRITEDGSPPDHSVGIMIAFINGVAARRWMRSSESARRTAVLANLEALFGPRAATPVRYMEKAWAYDPLTRGCFYGVTPPGVLSDFGHALREPAGRIRWAGTEAATEWAASMEGAVRSGIVAARAALAG